MIFIYCFPSFQYYTDVPKVIGMVSRYCVETSQAQRTNDIVSFLQIDTEQIRLDSSPQLSDILDAGSCVRTDLSTCFATCYVLIFKSSILSFLVLRIL